MEASLPPDTVRGNEKFLFHGTRRACLVGEDGRNASLCSSADCNLCSIIKDSFDITRSGMGLVLTSSSLTTNANHRIHASLPKVVFYIDAMSLAKTSILRFGAGIYTSACSSSACFATHSTFLSGT